MFPRAFSFANFEPTRKTRGKANISLTTLPKKVIPQFSKFANEKARRSIFGKCIAKIVFGLGSNLQTAKQTVLFSEQKYVAKKTKKCAQ